jgi:hypothetical protein
MICMMPIFTALPETKELQSKGGIQVSLTPISYQCRQDHEVSVKEVETDVSRATSGIVRQLPPTPGARFVEVTTTPRLKVAPDNLRFVVKINNQLPRVFRGAGTVVQFNVGGKLVAVDQTGYADLANIIVPPRTEQQVNIYGPPLSTLPDETTVGLFLYDVVTRTDAAGNITEKQNFEWYFKYITQVAPYRISRD